MTTKAIPILGMLFWHGHSGRMCRRTLRHWRRSRQAIVGTRCSHFGKGHTRKL